MRSSKEEFKKGIENAFSRDIKLNKDTMRDASKYIEGFNEEKIEGGLSDKKSFEDLVNKNKQKGKPIGDVEKHLKSQLNMGIKVEMEHTKDKEIAKEIAMDHLFEDPNYYTKLKKIHTDESVIKGKIHNFKNKKENKEATSSGSSGAYSPKLSLFSDEQPKKIETKEATTTASSGAYETPAAWAKSTKKKDWRGKSKTQIPGGSFVSIKKKCKKFPYCNQGDIKALNIYEKEYMKEAIYNMAKKLNLSENTIKAIIQHELEKKIKNK